MDLGTANTIIYFQDKVVVDEPSIVAKDRMTGEVVAIGRLAQQMHGKTSPVLHKGDGVFAGLPQPLTATRYHSLIAERDTLPDCLEVTAWLEDGTIMGLRHREHHHLQGVQFHPESVLTEQGHQLLANFLREAEG